ncbi:MAG: hypothetical protein Q4Q23_00900, partial [Methanobacteriaceae archaeon]|nr:hypothetical protein [Methanobacteriaceae archaeon]
RGTKMNTNIKYKKMLEHIENDEIKEAFEYIKEIIKEDPNYKLINYYLIILFDESSEIQNEIQELFNNIKPSADKYLLQIYHNHMQDELYSVILDEYIKFPNYEDISDKYHTLYHVLEIITLVNQGNLKGIIKPLKKIDDSLLFLSFDMFYKFLRRLFIVSLKTEYCYEIIEILKDLFKKYPENKKLLTFGIFVLHHKKDPNTIEKIDKILEEYPYKEIYYFKSQELYSQKKFSEALKCINEVFKIDSDFEDALDLRILILYNMGKYAQALKYSQKVLNSCEDPYKKIKIMNNIILLVSLLKEEGNNEEILKDYKDILELEKYYEHVCDCINEDKKDDDILDELRKIIKINPRYKNSLNMYINLLNFEKGNINEAEDLLNELSKTYHNDFDFIEEIAQELYNQKNYDQALKVIQNISNEDMNLDIALLKVKILKSLKDYFSAIKTIEYLSLEDQLNPVIINLKTKIYLAGGMLKDVKENIKLTIKLEENYEVKQFLRYFLEHVSNNEKETLDMLIRSYQETSDTNLLLTIYLLLEELDKDESEKCKCKMEEQDMESIMRIMGGIISSEM